MDRRLLLEAVLLELSDRRPKSVATLERIRENVRVINAIATRPRQRVEGFLPSILSDIRTSSELTDELFQRACDAINFDFNYRQPTLDHDTFEALSYWTRQWPSLNNKSRYKCQVYLACILGVRLSRLQTMNPITPLRIDISTASSRAWIEITGTINTGYFFEIYE